MKTGLTIQQMAQELLRQSKAKQDYLVNTGSLSLSVTSDAPQLRVTENGLDKITPLDIRQTAHRQLGTYLGIPQKYYELMRTDAPELLAYNANYWFSQKNELRTLRTMDGCARAFLSNRYRRIDNLDIASVTLPVIGELPEARFVSTQITDDFMYIKVVNPACRRMLSLAMWYRPASSSPTVRQDWAPLPSSRWSIAWCAPMAW